MAVTFRAKEWRNLFDKMKKNASNFNSILKTATATIGFRDVIKHFQGERGPRGKWAALKSRQGKILQDTGNLRNNFSPSNIENNGKNEVIFFNPTPYADTHDSGDSSRNIPQREFMYLTKLAEKKMATFVSEALLK